MGLQATYVFFDGDGTFSCHDSDGELVEIGSSPVAAPASLVPYLDSCPFVKRAGKVEVPDEAPAPDADDAAPDEEDNA